jgi:hypothetical protein
MEALRPKGKDLDEKDDGKDVALIEKSKKHGYKWAHNMFFLSLRMNYYMSIAKEHNKW